MAVDAFGQDAWGGAAKHGILKLIKAFTEEAA